MPRTTISEIRRESPHAVTLRLDLEGGILPYRPGQYVTIDPHQFEALGPALQERAQKRGKREGPGYFSLSSDAIEPGQVEVTVKATPATAAPLPHFLVREATPGIALEIGTPAGRYFLPAEPPEGITGFLHLCAGSGVAPNRGMIRHALRRGWPHRHLLVLQDRFQEDVLFRKDWHAFLSESADRFRMRSFFSSGGGYVTPELLRETLAGWIEVPTSQVFLCGPNVPRHGTPGFLDRWKTELRDSLGYAPGRILTEG